MADNRPCKAELLDWINTVSFVCDDTKLFLDTHPCNTEALEFYEEFKNQRMQALQSTICSFIWTHIRVTKQLFLISWNTKTVELPH